MIKRGSFKPMGGLMLYALALALAGICVGSWFGLMSKVQGWDEWVSTHPPMVILGFAGIAAFMGRIIRRWDEEQRQCTKEELSALPRDVVDVLNSRDIRRVITQGDVWSAMAHLRDKRAAEEQRTALER
jgi:hypothetical protein